MILSLVLVSRHASKEVEKQETKTDEANKSSLWSDEKPIQIINIHLQVEPEGKNKKRKLVK